MAQVQVGHLMGQHKLQGCHDQLHVALGPLDVIRNDCWRQEHHIGMAGCCSIAMKYDVDALFLQAELMRDPHSSQPTANESRIHAMKCMLRPSATPSSPGCGGQSRWGGTAPPGAAPPAPPVQSPEPAAGAREGHRVAGCAASPRPAVEVAEAAQP